ncbi:copper chaperone NosL [Chryseolinea serpens]|uniref:Copper chaperone NosL n=1 Tax=Chryseolinea serpens TaxID=947013 RepID=A0A1M5QT22_9BACT|nr:nitrous oxide reductase accessory protein NosL [Chryseolinea serpens]SHH16920.1 copper chaperone NosL [Chryseolinea serpens]
MKYLAVSFIALVSLFSCSVKPEPLVMGKDACYTCKMTLVDEKFGAEILTRKGKIYKFDDLNCMVNFIHSGYEPKENVASYLVANYVGTPKLLDATKSFYSQSDLIRSPMAGHVAAFERKDEFEKFNAEWHGTMLSWDELLNHSGK